MSSSSSSSSQPILKPIPPKWDGKSWASNEQVNYVMGSAKREMGQYHFNIFMTLSNMLRVRHEIERKGHNEVRRELAHLRRQVALLQQPVIVEEGKVNLIRPNVPALPVNGGGVYTGETFSVRLEPISQAAIDHERKKTVLPVQPVVIEGKQEEKAVPVPVTAPVVVDEQKPSIPLIPFPTRKVVNERNRRHFTPYGSVDFASKSNAFKSTLNLKQTLYFVKGKDSKKLRSAMSAWRLRYDKNIPSSSQASAADLIDRLRIHEGFKDFPCSEYLSATQTGARLPYPYVEKKL